MPAQGAHTANTQHPSTHTHMMREEEEEEESEAHSEAHSRAHSEAHGDAHSEAHSDVYSREQHDTQQSTPHSIEQSSLWSLRGLAAAVLRYWRSTRSGRSGRLTVGRRAICSSPNLNGPYTTLRSRPVRLAHLMPSWLPYWLPSRWPPCAAAQQPRLLQPAGRRCLLGPGCLPSPRPSQCAACLDREPSWPL